MIVDAVRDLRKWLVDSSVSDELRIGDREAGLALAWAPSWLAEVLLASKVIPFEVRW
jgi:hypothetical protein